MIATIVLCVFLIILLILSLLLARSARFRRQLVLRILKSSGNREISKSKHSNIRKSSRRDFREEYRKHPGNVAISVRNVTMKFRVAQEESSSLKEFLIRTITGKNQYREFIALNNVSFDINKGEVVGIVGTNGSGKSTILKIISGVLEPTRGRVITNTKKIQLLTLGTGFDMELTAKENVYLNGAIIGYSEEYIDEIYNEIVEFAELDGFMDERMKNFSSGMVSRLGFAIATMKNSADILILDEVLSVGDMFFRKKSEAKIKELIHSGVTVLMVSHSLAAIRSNCTKAVWIEKGTLKAYGDVNSVCDAYANMNK